MIRSKQRCPWVQQKHRFFFVFLGVLGLSASCSGPTGPSEPEKSSAPRGQTQSALGAGWHLLEGSENAQARIEAVPEGSRALFVIDQTYDAKTGRILQSYRATHKVTHGQSYWVFVGPRDVPVDPRHLVPPGPDTDIGSIGHFIGPKRIITPDERTSLQIYAWSPNTQHLTAVSPLAHLEPGQVYWVTGASPCDSKTWSWDAGEKRPESCDLAPNAADVTHAEEIQAHTETPLGVPSARSNNFDTLNGVNNKAGAAGPSLGLFSPLKETIYNKTHRVAGQVFGQEPITLTLLNLRTQQESKLSLKQGTFSSTVSLEEGINRFRLQASDGARNPSMLNLEFTRRLAFFASQPTRPPAGLEAWFTGEGVTFGWERPKAMADGSPLPRGAAVLYRVYVDGTKAQDTTDTEFKTESPAPDQDRTFTVRAIVTDREGQEQLSERSSLISWAGDFTEDAPPPGAFEPPSLVAREAFFAARPETAFSKNDGQQTAHLVYILAQPFASSDIDQIRYFQSNAYGKRSSWVPMSSGLHASGPQWRIAEVVIAAHGSRVVVLWLEQSKIERGSQILAQDSDDGGHQFSEPKTLRQGAAYKRDLDIAFDRNGDHHVIWAEANKVFYLKNFEGEHHEDGRLKNVFDQRKRWINQQTVKYHHTSHRACDEGDGCCASSYFDHYTLGIEAKGDDLSCDGHDSKCGLSPFGPYFERVEESFVEHPALTVSDTAITIVARRTRMFDNLPHLNDTWRGQSAVDLYPFLGPEISMTRAGAPEDACAEDLFRFQMGFRKTWQKDAYACPQKIPTNVHELEAEDQILGDHKQSQRDFYAYDHLRGHPQHWYQFLFGGTWSEEDSIQVAQRPLQEGAWSVRGQAIREVPRIDRTDGRAHLKIESVERTVELGWKKGAWLKTPVTTPSALGPEGLELEETLQGWRITRVDAFQCERPGEYTRCGQGPHPGHGPVGPSHPSVASHQMRIAIAYEKGKSDNPNLPEKNPIHLTVSDDGGKTWTKSSDPVAKGYMPKVAITDANEVSILYYAPRASLSETQAAATGLIKVLSNATSDDRTHHVLNLRNHGAHPEPELLPARPIHHSTHGAKASSLYGVPHLASSQNLLLAAWVKQSSPASSTSGVLTARATVSGQKVQEQTHIVLTPPREISAHRPFAAKVECVDQYGVLASGCRTANTYVVHRGGRTSPLSKYLPDPHTLNGAQSFWAAATGLQSLPQGQALATVSPEGANPPAAALAPADVESEPQALATAEHHRPSPIDVITGNAEGNRQKAKAILDALYDPDLGLQREYLAVEGDPDSLHLAEFGRVWAYTQGIAIAQYARLGDSRAIQIAETMCQEAEFRGQGAQKTLYGWPFSRNTIQDDWQDARRVTGANAWVVRGLGDFLASALATSLPPERRQALARCYLQGLLGLRDTVAEGLTEDLNARWLVTAGYTTVGLQNAETPERLGLAQEAGSSQAESLRIGGPKPIHLAYYDILDIIGYDQLLADKNPILRSFYRHTDGPHKGERIESSVQTYVLSENDGPLFSKLKEEARAQNIVTEHSLDTLSVLNHAIKHWTTITQGQALQDRPEILSLEELTRWRNHQRDAIFSVLWNEDEGRVHTGGYFDDRGAFVRSEHTAIDNCTWLSLSVDYPSLPKPQQQKLARCLQWTIDTFVSDDLEFRQKKYHGAFYFSKSFKDPYIEKSEDQERLYHLEATTGLILGLLRFRDELGEVYPREAAVFSSEAKTLWSAMQTFVEEHGAPYSTINIHNLMTRLPSATAAIWFIDVHDYLEAQENHHDRPLKNYVHDVSSTEAPPSKRTPFLVKEDRKALSFLWTKIKTSSVTEDTPKKLTIESDGTDLQGEPAWGKVALGEAHEDLGVFLFNEESALRGFNFSPDGGLEEFVRPLAFNYQVKTVSEAGEEVRTNFDPYRLFNHAPVNVTDLSLEMRMTRKDGWFLLGYLGFKDISVSATGTIGPLPSVYEDVYVLISVVLDEDEWVLGRTPLNDDRSFTFETKIGLDADGPELAGGRPVARLVHVTPTDRSIEWLPPEFVGMVQGSEPRPYTDEFIATSGVPTLEESGESVQYRAEGRRGEWYFHQHTIPEAGFLALDEIALVDRGTSVKIETTEVAQWQFRPGSLVVSEQIPLTAQSACTLRGGRCVARFEGGCEEPSLPIEAVCHEGDSELPSVCCKKAPAQDTLSVTYLEDQAWAALAALSQSDRKESARLVDGLLSTLRTEKLGESTYVQFAYAVNSRTGAPLARYYQTGPQMLALYALGQYVLRIDPDKARRRQITRTMQRVSFALKKLYWDAENGLYVEGSGWPEALADARRGETPRNPKDTDSLPRFSSLSLKTNVYAFFFHLVGGQIEDIFQASTIRHDRHALERGIASTFWESVPNSSGSAFGYPTPYKHEGRTPIPSWSDRVEASVLYTLFDLEAGTLFHAKRATELLTALEENRPAPSVEAGGLLEDARMVLLRRAAASFDPRQEELAWNGFQRVLRSPKASLKEAALIRIAENPAGLFGIDAGSILGTHMRRPDQEHLAMADARLHAAYVNTLFSLFASDHPKAEAYKFDTLVGRLTLIEFLVDIFQEYATSSPDTQQWDTRHWAERAQSEFASNLLRTVGRLKDLCSQDLPRLLHDGQTLESFFGADCNTMSERFAVLLTERTGGPDPALLLPLLTYPDIDFELVRLIDTLQHPKATAYPFTLGRLNPRTPESRYAASGGFSNDSKPISSASRVDDVRTQWQQAILRHAFSLEVDPMDRDRIYDTYGLDFIAMNNPAAPAYWSPEALEFRLLWSQDRPVDYEHDALSLADRDPVDLSFYLAEPEPDLSRGQMEDNVRWLRRFINTEAGGHLPYLARTSSLTEARIHHMMRTGKIRESDFGALAVGAGLVGPDAVSKWAKHFAFVDANSPTFFTPKNGVHLSLLSRHQEAITTGRIEPLPIEASEETEVPVVLASAAVYFLTDPADQNLGSEDLPCYEVYRFDASQVSSKVLAKPSEAEKYRIAECASEVPFVDPDLGSLFAANINPDVVADPHYAVRKKGAHDDFHKSFRAGYALIPRIQHRASESAGDAPESEARYAVALASAEPLSFTRWAADQNPLPMLPQPKVEGRRSPEAFHASWETGWACTRIIQLPAAALNVAQLMVLNREALNQHTLELCEKTGDYSIAFNGRDAIEGRQVYAFVEGSEDLNAWPDLLFSQRVALVAVEVKPHDTVPEGATPIEVAVFYTPSAQKELTEGRSGGPDILQTTSETLLSHANQTFWNSQVPVRFELTYAGEAPAALERGSARQAMEALLAGGGAAIHDRYQSEEADLAVVVVSESTTPNVVSGALDWDQAGNIVVLSQDAIRTPAFARGLGKTLGCRTAHRSIANEDRIFPYAINYTSDANGRRYSTLMGIRDGGQDLTASRGRILSTPFEEPVDRIPFFSSPDRTVSFSSAGINKAFDCQRAMASTAPFVGAWNGTIPWFGTHEHPTRPSGLTLEAQDGNPTVRIERTENGEIHAQAQSYVLTNTLDIPLMWRSRIFSDAHPSTRWDQKIVDVSPPRGVLEPHESVTVSVEPDADRIGQLWSGHQRQTLQFVTLGDAGGQVSTELDLKIAAPTTPNLLQETGGLYRSTETRTEPIVFHHRDFQDPDLDTCRSIRIEHHTQKPFDAKVSAKIHSDHEKEVFWSSSGGTTTGAGYDYPAALSYFFCLSKDAPKLLSSGPEALELEVLFDLPVADGETYTASRTLKWVAKDGLHVAEALHRRLKLPANSCRDLTVHNTSSTNLEWALRVQTKEDQTTDKLTVTPSGPLSIEAHGTQEAVVCTTLEPPGPAGLVESVGQLVLVDLTHDEETSLELEAIHKGLVAYYPFERPRRDESPYGHDLNSQRGPISESGPGRFGTGLSGEGWSSADAEPPILFETSLEPFSLSMWIGPQKEISEPEYVVGNISGFVQFEEVFFGRGWGLALEPQNHLRFELRGDEGQILEARTTSPFHLGTDGWVHIAVTWDGQDRVDIYTNGQAVGPIEVKKEGRWPIFLVGSGNHSMHVKGASSSPAEGKFHGIVDELRVYRGVLTEAEVLSLFSGEGAVGEPGGPPPRLDVGAHAASVQPVQFPLPEGDLQESAPDDTAKLPEWLRDNANWWAEDQIDDQTFFDGIEYLIEEGIVVLPEKDTSEEEQNREAESKDGRIPPWVQDVASFWGAKNIDDAEFVRAIQYLVTKDIIQLPTPTEDTPSDDKKSYDDTITLTGLRGGLHPPHAARLSWPEPHVPMSWTANWRRDGWLTLGIEAGEPVGNEVEIPLGVDAEKALTLDPSDEPHEEFVEILLEYPDLTTKYTLRVLLEEDPMPELVATGWRGGKYAIQYPSFELPKVPFEAWHADWNKDSWYNITTLGGKGGVESLEFGIETKRDVAQALEPRTEPYESFIVYRTEKGERIVTTRVLLYQRGTPSSPSDEFEIPPGLSWCVDEEETPGPNETQCRSGNSKQAYCFAETCQDPISFRLAWRLNDQPFSGFEPASFFGISQSGQAPSVGRHTNETMVEIEKALIGNRADDLQALGEITLSYSGERYRSENADISLIWLKSIPSDLASPEELAQRFDPIIAAQTRLLQMNEVTPYRIYLLPQELYIAADEGLSADARLSALSGAFTGERAIFLNSNPGPGHFSVEGTFSHEYLHWLVRSHPDRFLHVQATASFHCLAEGLADLIAVQLGHHDADVLDPEQGSDELISPSRHCPAYGELLGSGAWVGRCMMWHLQQGGYLIGEEGDAFVRNLFFPERPFDVDTCALEDPLTANHLFVYFTEAWSKAHGEFESLGPVVEQMGLSAAPSYREALNRLGFDPINPSWLQKTP